MAGVGKYSGHLGHLNYFWRGRDVALPGSKEVAFMGKGEVKGL